MSAHPWMANSTDAAKQSMLDAIGAASIDELFEQIPDAVRLDEWSGGRVPPLRGAGRDVVREGGDPQPGRGREQGGAGLPDRVRP